MTQNHTPIGGSAPGADESPEHLARLEADIDQTRTAISGDLRTLGERLSPEHLKQEAKEVMTEAKNAAKETLQEAKNVATETFREVKDDALETVTAKVNEFRDDVRSAERQALGFVRENAVPLALIGVGVAWFMSNRRSHDTRWEGDYAPRGHGRWRYPERGTAQPLDDARGSVSRAAEATRDYGARAKERARGWVEGAERNVSDVAGQVRDFAGREVEQVRGLAEDARVQLSRARDTAGRELRQARDLTLRTTDSHPLAVAAGAMAAGVCLGLLIPETQRESELLGAQRERWVGDAKQAIEELTHTAKDTAREVTSSLSGAAG